MPASRAGPRFVRRRASRILCSASTDGRHGHDLGIGARARRHALDARSCSLAWRHRCHHRCAVAGTTFRAAAAALNDDPCSIKRTSSSRPPGPSLHLPPLHVRVLLRAANCGKPTAPGRTRTPSQAFTKNVGSSTRRRARSGPLNAGPRAPPWMVPRIIGGRSAAVLVPTGVLVVAATLAACRIRGSKGRIDRQRRSRSIDAF
jgi:hypothetical protein